MTRSLACLAAVLVLAGCGLAASPQRSEAAILVGIGAAGRRVVHQPALHPARREARPLLPVLERGAQAHGGGLARHLAHHSPVGRSRAADQLQPGARLALPVASVHAAERRAVHARLQGLPPALAAGQGREPVERGQPPLAADLQEPQARGAVLQRGARQLPRLQDRRGGRDRRDQHGALAQGLQAHRQAPEDLGPPQLPRHQPAPRPEVRRHRPAAEGGQGAGSGSRRPAAS